MPNVYDQMLADQRVNPAALPRFPIALNNMPHGWLTPLEISLLYLAGLTLPGPFLEIGAWAGRSTVSLALGIKGRDSEKRQVFDVVDFGLVSISDWRRRLFTDPLKINDIDGVLANIFLPGGTIAALIRNLQAHDVIDVVSNIIRGDFLDLPLRREYGVVFCDTLHNEREIELYCPKIRELLNEDGWLICDDILDQKAGDQIKEIVGLESYILTHLEHKYTKFMIGCRKVRGMRV